MIDDVGMRILRSAKNELIVFEHVHKTRIAIDHRTGKIHDAIKDRMKGSDAAMRLPISCRMSTLETACFCRRGCFASEAG